MWRAFALGATAGAGGSALTMLALLRLYLQKELRPAWLLHGSSEEHLQEQERFLNDVKLMLKDYWPHPLLEFSGLISTIWCAMWASLPASISPGPVEVLTLKDGGIVSLHWCGNEAPKERRRVVLLLPGLNNEAHTSFIQEAMRHLKSQGFSPVALNYRGIGGLELKSPRLGCADSWMDLDEVFMHLRGTCPGAFIFGLGFSMGGAVLLRYLGEKGSVARCSGAVAIAAPMDIGAVSKYMESSIKKRFLNYVMTHRAKAKGGMLSSIPANKEVASRLDMQKVRWSRTLRQIEESTICVLHGYKDPEEYYDSSTPSKVLSRITVPTLAVMAEDDPIVSFKTLPMEELQNNPKIFTAVTPRGGHLGLGSGGMATSTWSVCMARRFLDTCSATQSRL